MGLGMGEAQAKVLLVENDIDDVALLSALLSQSQSGGFIFDKAGTWAEAVQKLKEQRYDALLLDLSLPDANGPTALLRARADAPGLPIVALTGNTNEALGQAALRQGAEDYIIKGQTDGRQMARALRYAIERNRAETGLRRAHDELALRVGQLEAEMSCRKAAEQVLRESEERYRTLFESAPVGIALSNERGEVVACNRQLCVIAGLSPEEARKRPIADFYGDGTERLIRLMRRQGKVADQEIRLKRKDGAVVHCLLQMERVSLSQERNLVLTLLQDITRQKQAEKHIAGVAALLESFATKSSRQHYLKAVTALLADWCECECVGVRLLDKRGRLPYIAHRGFSKEFLKNEGSLCLVPEGGCACVRLLMRRPRAGDENYSSPNGSFFCNHTLESASEVGATPQDCATMACVNAGYQSLAHAPLRYRGELLGSLHLADSHPGVFTPETVAFIESIAPLVGEALHRFGVEDSLLESEKRFRSMFERHHAVMLLLEPNSGQIVDANPAAANFYGYSRSQLQRMQWKQLTEFPTHALSGGTPKPWPAQRVVLILPHCLANGQTRTVEVYSSSIQVENRVLSFCIIHDITDRKRLEKQVLEISEKERQRVGQDLHDSLGGKLAGAALLGKALAHSLAARSVPESSLAEEVVQCINESIRQTRAIARGLCPVELSVSGLSGGLAEFAAETERQSGVACRFKAEEGLSVPDLIVALHLFRIAQEAVNNALRHAKARRVEISLRREGDQVLLEIGDDGPGLIPRNGQSRGMGLRTMQHRAEQIGAQLAFKSSQGSGTVISCMLPLARTLSPSARQ